MVLITGASTGLGLALARRLLRTDCRMALTARASSMSRFEREGIVEDERVLLLPRGGYHRVFYHALPDVALWGDDGA